MTCFYEKMKTQRIGRDSVQNTSRGRGVMNGREAPSAGRSVMSKCAERIHYTFRSIATVAKSGGSSLHTSYTCAHCIVISC